MAIVRAARAEALLPLSVVAGAAVTDRGGTRTGTVAEVMIAATDGGIAYVAVSVGGVLGVGERLFALPWAAFAIDPVEGELRLRFDAARFDGHDGFDKDAWPTAADASFGDG